MTLYSNAANGKLTPATLTIYFHACKIDDPGTERRNVTFGLTPLALAACNGSFSSSAMMLRQMPSHPRTTPLCGSWQLEDEARAGLK